MFLDKLLKRSPELSPEEQIEVQADYCASEMAHGNPDASWGFNIGAAPKTMSVNEFTEKVGHTAILRMSHYTGAMRIAKFDKELTIIANRLQPGIGEMHLDTVPPPDAKALIIFDRTDAGRAYEF